MRNGLLKHLLTLLFIFTIMEQPGVSLVSAILGNEVSAYSYFQPIEEEENSSRAEVKKSTSYWLVLFYGQIPAPIEKDNIKTYERRENKFVRGYFPSVPTPPPNYNG